MQEGESIHIHKKILKEKIRTWNKNVYSLENKGMIIRLAQKNASWIAATRSALQGILKEVPQRKSKGYMSEKSGLQEKGRVLEKE